MPLSQAQFNTLHVFVYREAFDADSLYQAVRLKLGADMYKEWVGPGLPFKDTVMKLIDKLVEVRMIIPFLDMVLAVRAAKAGIEDIQAIRDSLNAPTLTTSDQTSAITSSVEGVAGKLELAPVREIMQQSQGVLTALSAKIDLLNTYKGLHDELHNAKMQFRSLESSAKNMATDPDDALGFSQAVMAMKLLVAKIDPLIGTLPDDLRQEERDWLTRFAAAVTLAQQADEAADSVTARQGVQGVRGVLNTEPSRIDGKLSRTAAALDFNKLKDVFSAAAALPELVAEAAMLEQGRAATEQLLRQVQAQVNQHGNWQAIDRKLVGADDIMRMVVLDGPADFDGLWKGLKEGVTTLMTIEPDSEWAKKISACITSVDTARTTSDWKKLGTAFIRFRNEVTAQFFVVDIQLKAIAKDVNTLGDPLRNLLDKL